MVDMASRFFSELESRKLAREVKSGSCCAMSLLEDVIPFDHVSAGVYTVLDGTGLWDLPKCIMMVGNEHFLRAGFLTWAQRKVRLL